MSRKQTTYSDDIKATFTSGSSEKQTKKIAKDIKSLQKSFAPSQKFRSTLLKRLEGIHMVDEARVSFSAFNIFKVFGTVFSFVLMFGVLYMLYDVRQTNIYEETMISETQLHDDMPEGVGHKDDVDGIDGGMIETPEKDFTPLPREVLESSEDIIQEPEVEAVQFKEVYPEESVNFTIEKKSEPIQETPPLPRGNTMEYQEIHRSTEQQEENTESESMVVPNMMMDMPMEDANEEDSLPFVSDFQKICEEEYEGEFLFSSNMCQLPNGNICTEFNILSCGEEEDIEKVLEELNEIFGQ